MPITVLRGPLPVEDPERTPRSGEDGVWKFFPQRGSGARFVIEGERSKADHVCLAGSSLGAPPP